MEKCRHFPVMKNEMLQYLDPKANGRYLDCTFGSGGYTVAILESCKCYILSLDHDKDVFPFAQEIKNKYLDRFNFIYTNFADFNKKLYQYQFDGIVLDLGVSSMQLNTPSRGFSFMQNGPLDMRMNCSQSNNAKDFVNNASEESLAQILYQYGQEQKAKSIAKAIVSYRKDTIIDTTFKLAQIVRKVYHNKKGRIDPATKTFQAIRIYVNQELNSLQKFLPNIKNILTLGGRVVILSFHSLEDTIIKRFFKSNSPIKVAKSKYSILLDTTETDHNKWLKILTPKALKPSRLELLTNRKSRSAKLRAAEKIGN